MRVCGSRAGRCAPTSTRVSLLSKLFPSDGNVGARRLATIHAKHWRMLNSNKASCCADEAEAACPRIPPSPVGGATRSALLVTQDTPRAPTSAGNGQGGYKTTTVEGARARVFGRSHLRTLFPLRSPAAANSPLYLARHPLQRTTTGPHRRRSVDSTLSLEPLLRPLCLGAVSIGAMNPKDARRRPKRVCVCLHRDTQSSSHRVHRYGVQQTNPEGVIPINANATRR